MIEPVFPPRDAVHQKAQHPVLVESFALEWEHNERVLPALVRYSEAHLLMLAQIGVLPSDKAAALLSGLHGLRTATLETVPFDPSLDGLQPSLERVLTRQVGAETAGWLGAGRSRQECELVARQMVNRDDLLALVDELLALRGVVTELAERFSATLMPYHTWAQHAEPITLGYWFAATAEALAEDGDRLDSAFGALDAARASCGHFIPPPWPIDRIRVARWLGFSRLAENSLYAYASLDAELQVLSALASVANHLARVGTSLHLWASDEFGFLTFSDDMSGTSYAMPQKRNPYALRQLRPMAAQTHGAWIDVAQLHGSGIPVVGDGLIHAGNRLLTCLPRVRACVRVLAEALPGLRPDTARMGAACADDWMVASQLVYALVDAGVASFRQAHALTHHLVLELISRQRGPGTVTSDDLRRAAHAAGVMPPAANDVRFEDAALRHLLDPRCGLHRRASGGPAAASMKALQEGLRQRERGHRRRLDDAHARVRSGALALEHGLGAFSPSHSQ